jgi:hypothetical protein
MNNPRQSHRGRVLGIWASASLFACNYSFNSPLENCDGACSQPAAGGARWDASFAGQPGGSPGQGATGGSAGSPGADVATEVSSPKDARDVPIAQDLAKDLPSSFDVAVEAGEAFTRMDATQDVVARDLPDSADGSGCLPAVEAPLLFACLWDDTTTSRLTWIDPRI